MAHVRPLLAALLVTVLGGALLGDGSARADDEPSLRVLVQAYESHLGRRDEIAYAGQRGALEDIAALRSREARDTLKRLLARYGGADRRRDALLLGATLRYGSAKDLDAVIDWVEARKDPLLVDLLHRIVADLRLPSTRAHLREGVLRAATPRVKAQIIRALGHAGKPSAVAPLLRLVREPSLLVRVETLEALGRLRAPQALPVIQVFLRDADPHVRDAAARGLGLLGDARALPALQRALGDGESRVAESAAGALGRIGEARAIPALIAGLRRVRGKDLRLEDAFVEALQLLTGKSLPPDPELWRAWWASIEDQGAFKKEAEKPGTNTVPGPRYYGFPVRSSKLVFVLDVSRSMGWNKRLESAKKELIQVLEDLPRSTRFNLIVYSDQAYAWRKGLTPAKPSNVRRAISFVRSQKPLNGTNTHGALAMAFEDREADTIFFLSDGHPSVGRITDPDLILMRVRDWNRFRRVRVHGVALLRGQPPVAFRSLEDPERSYAFMKRLTDENSGHFKRVD